MDAKKRKRLSKMEQNNETNKRLLTTFRFLPSTLYLLKILANVKKQTQTKILEELIYSLAKKENVINDSNEINQELIKKVYED
ncbi:MAG: hypothetical protein LBD05_01015 [Mycoplasmataceae bacterium]|jgi:predicted Zn-dependent protease|nr:hypothetical protein [Mycoplasmataceae bacterium]